MYQIWFPTIKNPLEIKANTSEPNIAKSFIITPKNLLFGPPIKYPIAYNNLPRNTARPRDAAAIGKYIPAIKIKTRVEAIHYKKL